MRGILPCVAQEKFKSKKANIETRGTEKSEVLERNTKCTNIIEASVYSTKNVQWIIMFSEELKWVIKEKDCLNVEIGKVKKEIPTHELHLHTQY